jgi:hypothetical protein
MDVRKLDYYFMERFSFWLKTVNGCNHNTTMKYIANFKKIVLICVKNKWLPADPFPDFELTRREVIRHPLTQKAFMPARQTTGTCQTITDQYR